MILFNISLNIFWARFGQNRAQKWQIYEIKDLKAIFEECPNYKSGLSVLIWPSFVALIWTWTSYTPSERRMNWCLSKKDEDCCRLLIYHIWCQGRTLELWREDIKADYISLEASLYLVPWNWLNHIKASVGNTPKSTFGLIESRKRH